MFSILVLVLHVFVSLCLGSLGSRRSLCLGIRMLRFVAYTVMICGKKKTCENDYYSQFVYELFLASRLFIILICKISVYKILMVCDFF